MKTFEKESYLQEMEVWQLRKILCLSQKEVQLIEFDIDFPNPLFLHPVQIWTHWLAFSYWNQYLAFAVNMNRG